MDTDISERYIDLMKNVLIDYNRIEGGEYIPLTSNRKLINKIARILDKILRKRQHAICRYFPEDKEKRIIGGDWPYKAESMIGLKRMENIRDCVVDIIENNIPGDLIETGVWRGGATIFMKAILTAYSISNRNVWVADSFAGLPRPDGVKYMADINDKHYTFSQLNVPLEKVQYNFNKYNLLDSNVKFLKGWFKDTLPTLKNETFSIIRLDGDMYESTMDALVNLYPVLSVGGYIIIDDWGAVAACKQAVIDYRKQNNINNEITNIDDYGIYWKKT